MFEATIYMASMILHLRWYMYVSRPHSLYVRYDNGKMIRICRIMTWTFHNAPRSYHITRLGCRIALVYSHNLPTWHVALGPLFCPIISHGTSILSAHISYTTYILSIAELWTVYMLYMKYDQRVSGVFLLWVFFSDAVALQSWRHTWKRWSHSRHV